FPQRGKKSVGVMLITRQINRARLVVLEKNLLPCLAGICGTEYTAIRIRPVCMAQRRHVNQVRISRMDQNSRDVLRIVQANVCPRLAAISGPVHSIAVRDISSYAGLTRA